MSLEEILKKQRERAIAACGGFCNWCRAREKELTFNTEEGVVECIDKRACLERCKQTANYKGYK